MPVSHKRLKRWQVCRAKLNNNGEVESSQSYQMRMTLEGLTKERMLNHRTE